MAPSEASSKEKAPPRGRFFWLIRGLFLLVVSWLLVWALQAWILDQAVARSLSVVQVLDEGLGEGGPEGAGEWESGEQSPSFPLLPFSTPLAPDAGDEENARRQSGASEPSAPTNRRLPGARVQARASRPTELSGEPPIAPLPSSTRASKESVLAWANAQLVPRGRSVPASHGMPAGIEVFDAGGLGLGLVNRDRLIAVDGVAVGSRSDVVAAALAARGREQEVIRATLMRRTREGVRQFTVTIEQPYLELEETEVNRQ